MVIVADEEVAGLVFATIGALGKDILPTGWSIFIVQVLCGVFLADNFFDISFGDAIFLIEWLESCPVLPSPAK